MPATQAAVRDLPAYAPSIEFAVEPLWRCRAGVSALMENHGAEFTYFKSVKGPVDPDWALAESLELRGLLKIATARAGGTLVGYFMILLSPGTPHYKSVEHVFDDTFYMAPEYRAGWGLYRFVKFAVDLMENSGATILVVANKVNQDLAPIWKRLGFVPEEIRYTKIARRLKGK